MTENWTFGRKLATGFGAAVVLVILIGVVAIQALRSVVSSKDRVINVDAVQLREAETLQTARERTGSGARGFLLTREERYVEEMRGALADFVRTVEQLTAGAHTQTALTELKAISQSEKDYQQAVEQVIALKRTTASIEEVARAFENVAPIRDRLDAAIRAFLTREQQEMKEAQQASSVAASVAQTLVLSLTVVIILLAGALAFFLNRALSRQIGGSVGQIQSASAELQAAANQQATATREQATAVTEIGTTIRELLATSRQIAESAQRVAHIAGQTAAAGSSGDSTVTVAHESIAAIRRQVDLIVSQMVDLGKKSQQIGAVLDIVAELAEQTNILAINATIEASGAGETGKRFAVVADEIRKLADRVAGSTKEIRTLIEDVRSAVNTTVMTTESGSKSVDTGARQFSEVAAVFRQIAELVGTTTEAAREIELSTKQQTTAVEQVNVAIVGVAQASTETEASSGQTLQTAVQLSELSRELQRLVQPQARTPSAGIPLAPRARRHARQISS
jgi:methyl-accepting chemotaxis protein